MTRNDDFDKTIQSWLQRQAPPQAPDQVLESAMERVARQSQKRTWLQRLLGETRMATMTRAAALTAVVAIAAFIGFQFGNLPNDNGNVGSSPSPSASEQATPSGTPSSPEGSPIPEAQLLLRLMAGTEGGRVHAVTILDDGRVITSGIPGSANQIVERRLTAAGVQLIRDELEATGLTDVSADYNPEPKPGVEPPAYGGAGPSLEVGQPVGEPVVITWFLFGDSEGDYFQPQPEAETLQGLYERLTTLEDWLPTTAWADAEASPYRAMDYRIFVLKQDWGGALEDLPVESETVAWPLGNGIDAFGQDVPFGDEELRCGVVGADEAAAVVDALEAAGATPGDPGGGSFTLGERAASMLVTIVIQGVLPLDDAGCDAAAFPI